MQRDYQTDFLKGCAMLSVVLRHAAGEGLSLRTESFLGHPWQVFVLFMLSGFFLTSDKLEDTRAFLMRRLRTLYLPALFAYTVAILLHNTFIDIEWYRAGSVHGGTGEVIDCYGVADIFKRIVSAVCGMGHGELVMGAMWFVYVLMYALLLMCAAMFILKKTVHTKERRGQIMLLLITLSAVASAVAVNDYHIEIARLSILPSAMLCMAVGAVVRQRLQWQYNSRFGFCVALLSLVCCVSVTCHDQRFMYCHYQNLPLLFVGCITLLYVWGYVGRLLRNSFVGNAVAYVGRKSFWVMALHIAGLFLCNSVLIKMGVVERDSPMWMYAYQMNGRPWYIILYVLTALLVPLACAFATDRIKQRIC